jgi:2-polyprenyl-3-methyl-5-hydroxy-6-metoxy-1,4-benzoquinol methylase
LKQILRYHGLEEEGMSAADWIAVAASRNRHYHRQASRIARAFPLAEGRVLDFGCGDGRLLAALAERWPLTVTMLGVDIDRDLIEFAAANHARENVSFRWIRDPAVDVEPRAYDLVLSTSVGHHWRDPVGFLRVVTGFLRPGGSAILDDINPRGLYSRVHASLLYRLVFRPARADFEGYRHSRDHAFSADELRAALAEAPGMQGRLQCRRGRITIHLTRNNTDLASRR